MMSYRRRRGTASSMAASFSRMSAGGGCCVSADVAAQRPKRAWNFSHSSMSSLLQGGCAALMRLPAAGHRGQQGAQLTVLGPWGHGSKACSARLSVLSIQDSTARGDSRALTALAAPLVGLGALAGRARQRGRGRHPVRVAAALALGHRAQPRHARLGLRARCRLFWLRRGRRRLLEDGRACALLLLLLRRCTHNKRQQSYNGFGLAIAGGGVWGSVMQGEDF